MKILYLHQYFATPRQSSGTRSYEFSKRLIVAGHEVLMITSSAVISRPINGSGIVDVDGIPTIILDVPYSHSMPFPSRIRSFMRFAFLASKEAIRHPFDVVLATSTPLTIAIPAIIAKMRHRKPMVFEIRDLWPDVPIALGALRNPLSRIAARTLEKLAYLTSAHIVACSPGIAAAVIAKGVSPQKVTIIPNSCDIDVFDVPQERGQSIRSLLGMPERQPLVVYAGTFGRVNGVGYLADVAVRMNHICPEVRFLLVGEGVEKASVRDKAAKLGVLGRNLWIWDAVPKTRIVDVYSAATLVTSMFIPLRILQDNSANKFFDGLAASKPLAINYEGWQADLLRTSGAGIVLPPDDPETAANQICTFLQDEKGLNRASAAARHLSHDSFSRDAMAEKLINVLSNTRKAR